VGFFPKSKQFDLKESKTAAEIVDSKVHEFAVQKKNLEREFKKVERLETSLKTLFGGYYKRERQY